MAETKKGIKYNNIAGYWQKRRDLDTYVRAHRRSNPRTSKGKA